MHCNKNQVTEEQRYALVEYVIHLTSKDYDATLQDLITLQFIDPRVGADPQKAALVVPLLAKVQRGMKFPWPIYCEYRSM